MKHKRTMLMRSEAAAQRRVLRRTLSVWTCQEHSTILMLVCCWGSLSRCCAAQSILSSSILRYALCTCAEHGGVQHRYAHHTLSCASKERTGDTLQPKHIIAKQRCISWRPTPNEVKTGPALPVRCCMLCALCSAVLLYLICSRPWDCTCSSQEPLPPHGVGP